MQQQGLAEKSLQLQIKVNTAEKREIKVEQAGMSVEEIFSIPFNPSSRADQQPPTPYLSNQAVDVLSLAGSSYIQLQAAMSAKNKISDQPPVTKRNSKRRIQCKGEKEKEISSTGAKTFSTGVGSVTRFLPPGSKKPPTASEVDDDEVLADGVLTKKAKKEVNSQTQGRRRYRQGG